MKKEEDIYIKMLRFGKANLDKGIRPLDLVEHLQKNGHPNFTVNYAIMHHYWPEIFFASGEENVYNPNTSIHFYLRPGKYMALLEYDKAIADRKASRQSMLVAIAAIVLSLIAIVVDILFK